MMLLLFQTSTCLAVLAHAKMSESGFTNVQNLIQVQYCKAYYLQAWYSPRMNSEENELFLHLKMHTCQLHPCISFYCDANLFIISML